MFNQQKYIFSTLIALKFLANVFTRSLFCQYYFFPENCLFSQHLFLIYLILFLFFCLIPFLFIFAISMCCVRVVSTTIFVEHYADFLVLAHTPNTSWAVLLIFYHFMFTTYSYPVNSHLFFFTIVYIFIIFLLPFICFIFFILSHYLSNFACLTVKKSLLLCFDLLHYDRILSLLFLTLSKNFYETFFYNF